MLTRRVLLASAVLAPVFAAAGTAPAQETSLTVLPATFA
jgi:hypothetical protein